MKAITKISIVIVNYQTDDLVIDLISGINSHGLIEIILIDNSLKNTLEKKLPMRNDLHYFFTGENLGFAGGNNYGISRAKGEWFFLLNSDTKTNTNDILKLFRQTEENSFFVSAPKLVQPNNQVQNNVGYFDNFFKNPLNYIFARPRFINCSKENVFIPVDLLTGAAMLIHKSVFDKVGHLDDKKFFMYFEDIDFSYRLHKAGIKVLYCPEVKIIHFGGASSDQDTRQKNVNYRKGLQTYLTKNRGFLINTLNNLFHFLS